MRKEANFLSLCSCKVCLFRNLRTVLDGYYCAKGRVAGNFICPGLTVFQSITSVTFHPLNGELTLERLCFFVFFFPFVGFLLMADINKEHFERQINHTYLASQNPFFSQSFI